MATNGDAYLFTTEHFAGKEVVITEKMDGENTTMYRDGIYVRIRTQLAGEPLSAVDYTLSEARRQFENGEIYSPDEAIAKTHEHRGNYAELFVTCAPSGSGKSLWIDHNLPEHVRISLDVIREELTGRRDRMIKRGPGHPTCKEAIEGGSSGEEKSRLGRHQLTNLRAQRYSRAWSRLSRAHHDHRFRHTARHTLQTE